MSEPTTDLGAPDPARESAPLVVRTVLVDDPGPLLDLLPTTTDVDGLGTPGRGPRGLGHGRDLPHRRARPVRPAPGRGGATLAGGAVVRDEVGLPGTGLVCFGSFAFADEPGDSVLVVPRGGRRPPRRDDLGDHDRRRRDPRPPRPDADRAAGGARPASPSPTAP